MQCKVARKVLDAFRTGELSAAESRVLSGHLSVCAGCARELADIERLAVLASRTRVRAPRFVGERVLEETGDRFGEVETEIGPVRVAFNARGITMISPAATKAADFQRLYRRRRGRVARRAAVPERYASAVQQAAAGRPARLVPVDLAGLPGFERQVLLLLRRIPRGEVRPYLWLAREAGHPGAVRAVGTAMARNPVPFLLPCHRVVPAAGGIGNYAFGPDLKRELLQREGAPVEELEQLARSGVRYIGCKTTQIYCFPSCRDARRIRPENRIPFTKADEADSAGFRPCMRCRPQAMAS